MSEPRECSARVKKVSYNDAKYVIKALRALQLSSRHPEQKYKTKRKLKKKNRVAFYRNASLGLSSPIMKGGGRLKHQRNQFYFNYPVGEVKRQRGRGFQHDKMEGVSSEDY